jgi:hypothetical protein
MSREQNAKKGDVLQLGNRPAMHTEHVNCLFVLKNFYLFLET